MHPLSVSPAYLGISVFILNLCAHKLLWTKFPYCDQEHHSEHFRVTTFCVHYAAFLPLSLPSH